jgi:hypothetical protein
VKVYRFDLTCVRAAAETGFLRRRCRYICRFAPKPSTHPAHGGTHPPLTHCSLECPPIIPWYSRTARSTHPETQAPLLFTDNSLNSRQSNSQMSRIVLRRLLKLNWRVSGAGIRSYIKSKNWQGVPIDFQIENTEKNVIIARAD